MLILKIHINTVEEAATKLSEHILEAAKRAMPIKTISMKQNSPLLINDKILLM